jgi:hypothetical protein
MMDLKTGLVIRKKNKIMKKLKEKFGEGADEEEEEDDDDDDEDIPSQAPKALTPLASLLMVLGWLRVGYPITLYTIFFVISTDPLSNHIELS